MILGAAIAKISDSQIFCEWGDESQSNLLETRSLIKNFLRERRFLNHQTNPIDFAKYSLYFVCKKTCVYVSIFNKTNNYGHIKEFLLEVQREFEEVNI